MAGIPAFPVITGKELGLWNQRARENEWTDINTLGLDP